MDIYCQLSFNLVIQVQVNKIQNMETGNVSNARLPHHGPSTNNTCIKRGFIIPWDTSKINNQHKLVTLLFTHETNKPLAIIIIC
uniref:Putative ovule protein n=1 Tax=Solanum chacoense TaxID=4108 RepID=A0A0V0H5I7_SOLCH